MTGTTTPDALMRALDDVDAGARLGAARALARLEREALVLVGDIVTRLRGCVVRERDAGVRGALVVALVRIGGEPLLREVARALRSADPAVVAGAARVLGDVGDRRVVPNLVEAFRTEDVVVGTAIAAALGALGDPVVVPWLVAAAEQGFCVVECCRALGRVGDRRALPLLRARADATDERVRLAAREALHLLAERSAHEAGASGADADRRGQ